MAQRYKDTTEKARGGRTTELTHEDAQTRFLRSLARYGNVSMASKAAHIGRKTAYRWRQDEADFAHAWEDALKDAEDVMAKEAWRRAVKGTTKPVYQGGEQVGSVQEYSDTLLIFLLKATNPEKYRERTDVNHSGGQTLRVEYVNNWRESAGKEGDDE